MYRIAQRPKIRQGSPKEEWSERAYVATFQNLLQISINSLFEKKICWISTKMEKERGGRNGDGNAVGEG